MKLSNEAKILLGVMKNNNVRPVVKTSSRRATYYSKSMGLLECTKPLRELLKAKLVKIVKEDHRAGWYTYGPLTAEEQE